MSAKGLSKNIVAVVITLVVIAGAIAAFSLTSGGGQSSAGGGGTASLNVESHSTVGANLIRLTIRNTGTAEVRLGKVTVTDTDLEGSQVVTTPLRVGEATQVDVTLTKGALKTGTNVLKIKMETDRGNIEQQYTIIVTPASQYI